MVVVLLAHAASVLARPIDITVLHTTDIHGHLLPTTDYEGVRDVGGLLRCATRIDQLRSEKANVLLLDCGDLFQGSAESYLSDGRATIRAMEYLRYDAWILGNHEFDWGLPKLLALHDATSLPMVAANIVGLPQRPSPLQRVQPFVIREFEGVRVAVVGLITPGVPTWSTPDLLGDTLFERSVQSLKRVMPQVRAAQPDILLLATHQGLRPYGDDHANEVNAIAAAFPEIDAIIGGHSHQPVERALVGGHTLFTQAGYHAIWLGQLDLTYDTVARRLVQKRASLHRIGADVPMHTGLTAVVQQDLDRAETYLRRPVGRTTGPITHRADGLGRSPVQQLICRALAEATGADLVLHGLLDEEDLQEGEVLMSDIWRLVPYENRAAVLLVTAAELAEILTENLKRRGSTQFMGPYRFSYAIEGTGGESKAVQIRLADGSIPHPRQRLKIAVNSYVVASGGQRFPRLREIAERPETRLQLLNVDTRTAVIDYLDAHQPLSPADLKEDQP
jgi:5'-nucleotidase